MKTKTIVLALALCFVAATACHAGSTMIGTWQLNEAKSKFGPGATKNSKVVYEAAGDDVKATIDGTDSSGNATHTEWTGKFDGKPYPVTGGPSAATRSLRKVNDQTLAFVERTNGKLTASGRIVLAPDGKSRTVTSVTTNSQGEKIRNIAVYDKE